MATARRRGPAATSMGNLNRIGVNGCEISSPNQGPVRCSVVNGSSGRREECSKTRMLAQGVEIGVVFDPFAIPEALSQRFLEAFDRLVRFSGQRVETRHVVLYAGVILIDSHSAARPLECFRLSSDAEQGHSAHRRGPGIVGI